MNLLDRQRVWSRSCYHRAVEDSSALHGRGGAPSSSRREVLNYAVSAPILLILGAVAAALSAQKASAPPKGWSISCTGWSRRTRSSRRVDPVRDDAEAYADRLRRDGVPVSLTRYTGAFHGFVAEIGAFAQAKQAIDEVCAHLRGVAATQVRARPVR
jgi:hypothetical protein